MSRRRVLAIGLDGYERSLGEQLMEQGELPALNALRERSARFLLDHGPAARSGLAWEQVSIGRSPEATKRWSAVYFDRRSYDVWQEGATLPPFVDSLNLRTVVFDPPYFDLNLAPSVRGITNWGAHDPGVPLASRPPEIRNEIESRFGLNPAETCMYDVVWPSPDRTRTLGELLVQATRNRTRAARWLFGERCPNWDFGLVVAGEIHSAIEALWHGVDPTHPLHSLPSAAAAGEGLRAVYRATDSMVQDLVEAFPEATVVAFSMGGMGPNRSDLASMVLLSELLYRNSFGQPLLRVPESWSSAPRGIPMLPPNQDWAQAIKARLSPPSPSSDFVRRAARKLLPEGIKKLLRHQPAVRAGGADAAALRLPLDWMPTILYQPFWHSMRYFALPSFYDGRVRINLAGREKDGLVRPEDYESACQEVESLIRDCRDLTTGESVVDHVEREPHRDPYAIGPTESDMVIVWRGAALGFEHPKLGRIGPLPYRRTGGHTGPFGVAYFAGDGIPAGDHGVRSSFDIVPTIVELLGEDVRLDLSGRSLLENLQSAGV